MNLQKRTTPANMPRSLSAPMRNVLILRSASFSTPKELGQSDTNDGKDIPCYWSLVFARHLVSVTIMGQIRLGSEESQVIYNFNVQSERKKVSFQGFRKFRILFSDYVDT